MRRILTLFVLVATAALTADCQLVNRQTANPAVSSTPAVATNFIEKLYTNASGEKMRYLLFVPKGYNQQARYPLVLWLHGAGSRGDDLKALLTFGDKHGLEFLARDDNQSHYPAFIVAPLCPANKFWGDPDANQPTTQMKLVLEILDQVQANYLVDTARLYVMGLSLGGYGTWDIITRRPGMFAAAVPICGGGNTAKAPLMTKTAIWAFHGDQDQSVDVAESRRMIAALNKAGANPKYSEYKGVGHNSWERAFAEPDLLRWMFAQKR